VFEVGAALADLAVHPFDHDQEHGDFWQALPQERSQHLEFHQEGSATYQYFPFLPENVPVQPVAGMGGKRPITGRPSWPGMFLRQVIETAIARRTHRQDSSLWQPPPNIERIERTISQGQLKLFFSPSGIQFLPHPMQEGQSRFPFSLWRHIRRFCFRRKGGQKA
jgi:hypothetical protein